MKFRNIASILIILNILLVNSTILARNSIDKHFPYESNKVKEINSSFSAESFLELSNKEHLGSQENLKSLKSIDEKNMNFINHIHKNTRKFRKGSKKIRIQQKNNEEEFKNMIENQIKENNEINLFLNKTELNENKIKILCEALSNKENKISALVIVGSDKNYLGDDGVKSIAKALEHNTSITKIKLANNRITAKGVEFLRDPLKENKTIEKLELNNNSIGDDAVQYLREALDANNSLEFINLNSNGITDDGVKFLCHALKKNKKITRLGLSGNEITDKGAGYISKVLKGKKNKLQSLELNNNRITIKGADILAQAMEKKERFLEKIATNLDKEKMSNSR